jgi:hypothetical protein
MKSLTLLITTRRAKLKLRDNVFESERLRAWNTRENIVHRFANGHAVEIKLTDRRAKP